jgi:uncharacterized protein (UPF0335 family)
VNRAQKTEYANMALDVLADNRNYWMTTSSLYANIRSETPLWFTQAKLREILGQLRLNGTVLQYGNGSGKHKWRLAVQSWDRDYPMSVQTGATPVTDPTEVIPPESEEEETAAEETVDTSIGSEAAADIQRLKSRVRTLEGLAEVAEDHNRSLADRIEELTVESKSLKEQMERQVKTLKIEKWDGKVIKLKDVILPSNFEHVLDLAKARMNILLVGPAGCGKSYLAKLISKTLGLDFYKVGGSGGLSEEHLLGYARPNLTSGKDKFITTPFLTAFENGGLCLIDELDGANENALLCLNPALDKSRELPVPNRDSKPIAMKNEDFVACGTANTMGRGADRKYVGRNQLDEAFLDRFRAGIVECDYDPVIEAAVCPNDEIREWCQRVRKQIHDCGIRRIMSTRFMEDAYIMHKSANWDLEKIQSVFYSGWSAEERGRTY